MSSGKLTIVSGEYDEFKGLEDSIFLKFKRRR